MYGKYIKDGDCGECCYSDYLSFGISKSMWRYDDTYGKQQLLLLME
jgi:hypothetical protein